MGSSTSPLSPDLSKGQIALLGEHGEERTAAKGDYLFGSGIRATR